MVLPGRRGRVIKDILEVKLWGQLWYSGEVRKENPGKILCVAQRLTGKMALRLRVKENSINGTRWSSDFYFQVLSHGQTDSQTKQLGIRNPKKDFSFCVLQIQLADIQGVIILRCRAQ